MALQGKVALVTGAASGIGEQTARKLGALLDDCDVACNQHRAGTACLDTFERCPRIRIIVQEPRIVVGHGHRLIPLTQRLPSIFTLRTPMEDNDLQYPSAFLLNDVSGYYFRVLGTRFEGEAVNYSPGRHAQLQEYFNQVWERSEPSEDLRLLNI